MFNDAALDTNGKKCYQTTRRSNLDLNLFLKNSTSLRKMFRLYQQEVQTKRILII